LVKRRFYIVLSKYCRKKRNGKWSILIAKIKSGQGGKTVAEAIFKPHEWFEFSRRMREEQERNLPSDIVKLRKLKEERDAVKAQAA